MLMKASNEVAQCTQMLCALFCPELYISHKSQATLRHPDVPEHLLMQQVDIQLTAFVDHLCGFTIGVQSLKLLVHSSSDQISLIFSSSISP